MSSKLKNLILYICAQIPESSNGALKINKLVWFIESEYFRKYEKQITNAKFAAIDHGPVIDGYSKIFSNMESSNLMKIDKSNHRHKFRALKNIDFDSAFTAEEREVIRSIITNLGSLNEKALEDLSHQDAYNITLHESKGKKGRIIDMNLTLLDYSPLDNDINDSSLNITDELIKETEEILSDED